jgi:sialate O-acetylesterase
MIRFLLLAFAGAVVACAGCTEASADVQPAACFGDHMVLQRETPVPVWGAAAPGETVTVLFGEARAETTADAQGRWRVTLPALAACPEPAKLMLRGRNEVTIADVLVGEVWLCAGQSNMLLPLARAQAAAGEIKAANRPLLRLRTIATAATGDRAAYTPEQILKLSPADFTAGAWAVCSPQTARDFSAVGYFLGARLQEDLGVPVGIICAAVGGSPTEAWIRPGALASDRDLASLVRDGDWTRNPALAGWCTERAAQNLARARRASEPIPGDGLGPNHPFKPGFLWESCIAPLVPLAIRGIAWYQGESNADSPARVAQHARLFPALVRDWRRQWGRQELPVAFVQLPAMNRPDWPAFRETQRLALVELSPAGMAVTIDLGMKNEVHPPDKKPVGERLAGWALAEVYGKPVAASGPLPLNAKFPTVGAVEILFAHAGRGLRTTDGEPPRHFEVAGPDGVFRTAAAARIDRDRVVVEPAAASSPARQIRYAWLPFPEPPVNLVNVAGLPAAPFWLTRDARRAD